MSVADIHGHNKYMRNMLNTISADRQTNKQTTKHHMQHDTCTIYTVTISQHKPSI